MPSIKGTISVHRNGATVKYYPQTTSDQVIIKDPNSVDGTTITLEKLLDDGLASSGGSLQHKDGYVTATVANQKQFIVPIESGMPSLIKMGLDVYINSTWISPSRYTVSSSSIILNDNEVGLGIGQKLEYVLHYGHIGSLAVSMDTIAIDVLVPGLSSFPINRLNFDPRNFSIIAIIGGTVIVPNRFTFTLIGDVYNINFIDYPTGIEVGRVITILLFEEKSSKIVTGGSLVQYSKSVVTTGDTRVINIPEALYSRMTHTFIMFVDSALIMPKLYDINDVDKQVVLKMSEAVIPAGKTVDFIFTCIQKEINMVANYEIDRIKDDNKFKTASIPIASWISDSKYPDYPFRASIFDGMVKVEDVVNITFDMPMVIKYSGVICNATENIDGNIYLYASAKPTDILNVKYLIYKGGI